MSKEFILGYFERRGLEAAAGYLRFVEEGMKGPEEFSEEKLRKTRRLGVPAILPATPALGITPFEESVPGLTTTGSHHRSTIKLLTLARDSRSIAVMGLSPSIIP